MRKEDLNELESFLARTKHAEEGEWLAHIEKAILAGETDLSMGLAAHALDDGVDPDAIERGPMVSSMRQAGQLFKDGDFFIPEIIMSTRALKAALYEVERRFPKTRDGEPDPRLPTVMLGTVKGDYHDIGKNLAGAMFQARGYRVIDLGVDVPAKRFAEAAEEHRPDVIGLSAMLTTTVGQLELVMRALEEAGIRDELEVYVSGVPVTQKLADEIGADKYCADLGESLDYLEEFVLE